MQPSYKETLYRFCDDNPIDYVMDLQTVFNELGGRTSGMYGVAMFIVDFMFKLSDKPIKGAILHGITSSGKSTLCKYVGEIFSSYTYEEKEGDFDKPIDKE